MREDVASLVAPLPACLLLAGATVAQRCAYGAADIRAKTRAARECPYTPAVWRLFIAKPYWTTMRSNTSRQN